MNHSASLPARQNMLKSQILTGHVLNQAVLDALLATPREAFVPPAMKGVAYVDEEVPLGDGRFLLEPLAFARMLEHAAITKQQTVLDIGCGTGYSSAILAQIAARVVAVEESPALAASAKAALEVYGNVTLQHSALIEGARNAAPYDVILIEGAIEYVPQALADQLREGGRLFAFEQNAEQRVGTSGLNTLVEYKKIHNMIYRTALSDASVAKLTAFNKPPMFAF